MWKSVTKTSVSFSASLVSGKYYKTVYYSVGVLESFSANPLRWLVRSYLLQNLTLKESHLLINFAKNELPGKYFFKDFKAFYRSFPMSYDTYTFSLFAFALVRCIFCFSFPWIQKLTNNKTCFFKINICRSIFNYS